MTNNFDEPPSLKAIREQIRSFEQKSHFKTIYERLQAMNESPSIAAMLDRAKTLESMPYLRTISERLNSVHESPGLAGLIAQAKLASSRSSLSSSFSSVYESPSLVAAAERLRAMDQQWSTLTNKVRIGEFPSIYDQLKHSSPLIEFLSSQEGKSSTQNVGRIIEAGGVAVGYATATAEPVVFRANDALDNEIIRTLKQGSAPEALPVVARQRLLDAFMAMLMLWDILLNVVATEEAYQRFRTRLDSASAPVEVRHAISATPDEERAFLVHIRVVIRNGTTLRSEPTTQSDSLASLPLATPVEVLDGGNSAWLRVSVEHFGEMKEGWVYRSLTAPVPAPRS